MKCLGQFLAHNECHINVTQVAIITFLIRMYLAFGKSSINVSSFGGGRNKSVVADMLPNP